MKGFLRLSTAVLVLLVFAACATTKPAAPSPEPTVSPSPTPSPGASPSSLIKPDPSSIGTDSTGFSPLADADHNSISFDLNFGNANKVKVWKVMIKSNSQFQKTFTGMGPKLPSNITWDGRNDDNNLVSDGTYAAVLTVDYQDTYISGLATSRSFLVGVSAPTGAIKLSTPLFSPIESTDTITLTVQADSKVAKIDSWSMNILDPAGHLFKSFSDKWPANTVKWDGKNVKGELVESAEDYPVETTIRDSLGNTSTIKSMIPVDVLIEKTATGYRILSSRIFFKAYTDNYVDVPANLSKQNKIRLDQLARKLEKFPNYKIRVVGHAVMENWDDPKLGREEQETELLPLSLNRAKAIIRAMVDRGLNAKSMTAEGVGASDQLVPDSNLDDRWRNRRVALFIDR